MIQVAIIEDDPFMLDRLTGLIAATADMTTIGTAAHMEAGSKLIDCGGYDVLLCDLGLPDGSGIPLIRKSAQQHPAADIIVITIFAEQAKVISSIKAGARGYLLKDESLSECADGIRLVRQGGSPITPIIARQLLTQFQSESGAADSPEVLSPREREVLNLLARGFSYTEIAQLISVSPQTVGTFVKRIYRKLEVKSRSEAVFEASSRGIISVH